MADKMYFTAMVKIVVHTDETSEDVEARLAECLCELPDIEGGTIEVIDLALKMVDAK